MNATTDNPVRPGSPLPPPPPRPMQISPPVRRAEPAGRARSGVWSLVAVVAGVAGIALAWFPGGGHGRPDVSGPSLVEVFGLLGGAGLGVGAVALGITLLATIEPHGWGLVLAVAAIPIGLIACLMASVVAFSG